MPITPDREGGRYTWTYDARGHLVRTNDSKTTITTFRYDKNGRLVEIRPSQGDAAEK